MLILFICVLVQICSSEWTSYDEGFRVLNDWSVQYCSDEEFDINAVARLTSHNFQEEIVIVSYVDERIWPYAQYSIAITNLYAKLHHYRHVVLKPTDLSDYQISSPWKDTLENGDDIEDVRWIKVWIMFNLLHDPDWDHVHCFIWMDADLIVLDLFERFFGKKELEHDILLSSEYHAETGVANTGFFIINNSDFARSFLSIWYNDVDHAIGHDQIGFDFVYKNFENLWQRWIQKSEKLPPNLSRDIPVITDHIKILPTNAMNSIPPAYLYHQPDDKVLHLMGEDGGYRAKVFHHVLQNICKRVGNVLQTHSPSDFSTTEQLQAAFQSMLEVRDYNVSRDSETCDSDNGQKFGLTRYQLASMLLNYTSGLIDDTMIPDLNGIFQKIRQLVTVNSIEETALNYLAHFVRQLVEKVASLRESLLQQGKVLHSPNIFPSEISAKSEPKWEYSKQRRDNLLCHHLRILKNITDSLSDLTGDMEDQAMNIKLPAQTRLELYNIAAMLLNDLLQELESSTKLLDEGGGSQTNALCPVFYPHNFVTNSYEKVHHYLQQVLKLVNHDQQHLILEMLGMHYMNFAIHLTSLDTAATVLATDDTIDTDRGNFSRALDFFQLSIKTYEIIPWGQRNLFQVIILHETYAMILCKESKVFNEETVIESMHHHFNEAIYLMKTLLSAEQQVKEDHYRLVKLLSTGIECHNNWLLTTEHHQRNIYDETINNWEVIWQQLEMQFSTNVVFRTFMKQHKTSISRKTLSTAEQSGKKKMFRKKKKRSFA
jgi:hypothetical protein